MAVNDISLTSGMRSNLLSLQNTVDLLNRTQNRLATGKKVNSAIDNPVSFFASQALTNRASKIDSLKDAMGQAVSTITAADKGITAITAMIEQAKGIAQQALSAKVNPNAVSLTLDTVVATDTVVLGATTFTAVAANPGDDDFLLGATDTDTAANLAAAINDHATAGSIFRASAAGTVVTISKVDGSDMVETDVGAAAATFTEAAPARDMTELAQYMGQYNTLREQITALAEDSGYKGKNLLSGTQLLRSLNVQFEGATLAVQGFNATAGGLGMAAATWTANNADNATTLIGADLDLLDAALDTLSQNSSKLSGNLSIITVRQDFSTNMINTLTEGSDKLTLADTNEEGANMLMLQTRQSLSTTALSLSAQAAQSVLRLFQ